MLLLCFYGMYFASRGSQVSSDRRAQCRANNIRNPGGVGQLPAARAIHVFGLNQQSDSCVCKMNECRAQRVSQLGYAPKQQTSGCFPSEVEVPVISNLKNRTMEASADGNLQLL